MKRRMRDFAGAEPPIGHRLRQTVKDTCPSPIGAARFGSRHHRPLGYPAGDGNAAILPSMATIIGRRVRRLSASSSQCGESLSSGKINNSPHTRQITNVRNRYLALIVSSCKRTLSGVSSNLLVTEN